MTGLLLKELKYRGIVRRCLVIVPGHLKDQWLREMKERFGETFTVVDRAVVNANWGRNVWQDTPQVIASMDFAKQDDVMASLGEARWDLVIVDEAHKMAAYRYGDKLDRTERYKFGELLSRTSESGPTGVVIAPPAGGMRKFTLSAKIPWDKLSDFLRGVIMPLHADGAKLEVKVSLQASSDSASIRKSTLDHKVRETLRQINAEVEEDSAE